MKKINLLFIFILLITVSSCVHVKTYSSCSEFIDSFYETITDVEKKYVAIDFRPKENYEKLHIKQFQNFDGDNINVDDLIEYLTSTYNKKTIVYLYNTKSLSDELIKGIKNHYRTINILIEEEDILLQSSEDLLTLETGEYDCGC